MVDNFSVNALSSIEPQAPQPGAAGGLLGGDPLAVIGAALKMQYMKQSQAKFAAEWAQGQNAQASTDAQGNLDTYKNQALNAATPDAAYGAGDVANNLVVMRQNQTAAANAQLGLASAKNAAANAVIGSYAQKTDVGLNDVPDIKAALARAGLDPAHVASTLSNANSDADVKKILATAANFTMGPAAAANPQPGPPGPNYTPTSITTGQRLYGGGAGGGAPAGMPVSPPPGVGEAQTAAAKSSADVLTGDLIEAHNYQRNIYPLQQAIPALQALGTTGTGPGAETLNNIQSWLQSSGIPGMNSAKIENFDVAKKYLIDFVNQTGSSGTNDKLAAAFAGNPSVGISNAAAVDVAKSALALQRMKQAQVLAFGLSGLPEGQYTKWAAEWNTAQDPRAFGVDMMSPGAKQALETSLGPASAPGKPNPVRDRFMTSLAAAANPRFPLINLRAPQQAPNGQ